MSEWIGKVPILGCSLKTLGLYPRVTLFNILIRTLFCSGYIVVWFVLVGLTYV